MFPPTLEIFDLNNWWYVGEEGVKSYRGKKSQALLTHLLWPNFHDDVIIKDTFLKRSSEGKLKLVLQIQGRFSPTLVIFGISNRYFDFQSFWCSPRQLHCGMICCSYKVFLMFGFHAENSVFAMWPPWSHDHKLNYRNSAGVNCHTVGHFTPKFINDAFIWLFRAVNQVEMFF